MLFYFPVANGQREPTTVVIEEGSPGANRVEPGGILNVYCDVDPSVSY